MRRGEIWWAKLPVPTGSEPGYRRPVVVVQTDDFNRSTINTVICVAITSNMHLAYAPGNVTLSARISGLRKPSVINVSQLITLDKGFFVKKVTNLNHHLMGQIDEGLRLVLKL